MQIILAKNLGFCSGVRRAYTMVETNHSKYPKPVQIWGALVHNPHVTRQLESWGIKEVAEWQKALKGTLILSSHGNSLRQIKNIQATGLKVIDTACPKVTFVMAQAKAFKAEGRQVLILGDKDHQEIKAVNETIENQGIIFKDKTELLKIINTSESLHNRSNRLHENLMRKSLALISQTTQNLETFKECEALLKEKAVDLKIKNTICLATQKRQGAARDLLKKVDVMLVIGSKTSANSQQLFNICKKAKEQTFFIDNHEEIKPEWFKPADRVGITAGASTPDTVIQAVIKQLRN